MAHKKQRQAKHVEQHPAWMQIAFKDLRHASDETIEFLADHANEIKDMPAEEAIEKGYIKLGDRRGYFGFIHMKRMAQVFEMFMALGDD